MNSPDFEIWGINKQAVYTYINYSRYCRRNIHVDQQNSGYDRLPLSGPLNILIAERELLDKQRGKEPRPHHYVAWRIYVPRQNRTEYIDRRQAEKKDIRGYI